MKALPDINTWTKLSSIWVHVDDGQLSLSEAQHSQDILLKDSNQTHTFNPTFLQAAVFGGTCAPTRPTRTTQVTWRRGNSAPKHLSEGSIIQSWMQASY